MKMCSRNRGFFWMSFCVTSRFHTAMFVYLVADALADTLVLCSFQAFPGHSIVHASGGLHAGAHLRPPDWLSRGTSQGASATRWVAHPVTMVYLVQTFCSSSFSRCYYGFGLKTLSLRPLCSCSFIRRSADGVWFVLSPHGLGSRVLTKLLEL